MPNIRIFRKIIVGIIGRRRGNGVERCWHSKIIEHGTEPDFVGVCIGKMIPLLPKEGPGVVDELPLI